MSKFYQLSFVVLVAGITYIYLDAPPDRESLRGKRVLVTGASQNIGEEIAYQYAKRGANIVITARRENELRKVANRCKELGAQDARFIVADMSKPEAFVALVQSSVRILGGLDILVLNHVIARYGRWNGSQEDFKFLEKSIPVNYYSYVRVATAAMPHLQSSKGQIIVVASQAGRPGIPNLAAYGGSKSAVINFFTSLQVEAIKRGDLYPTITICILGAINTKEARWIRAEEQMQLRLYPVTDTASVIIDGGIGGERYVYAPAYIRYATLMRELNPELFDRLLVRFLY